MPVSFSSFPADWKLPLVWIEVDSSQAGTVPLTQPVLLIGQKLAAGTAPADVPIAIASVEDAGSFFGIGSMLERMVVAFLKDNAAALLYCIPLAEPAAGVAALGSITVTTAATAPGVLVHYIGGQRVPVSIIGNETASQQATKIANAINAVTTLPVTAVAVAAAVNLTCRWKGATGNDIILLDTYGGPAAGEALPVGMVLTYVPMATGAGAPSLTNAIAAMGDEKYDFTALPFTDSVSLGDLETEYGFGDTGRWGWMRQLYGSIFGAKRDSYANLVTFGPTDNSPVASVMAVEPLSPSPVWVWAASYTAKAARALLNDPARPLQTLEMTAALPAARGARFSKAQRNNLAGLGLAVQSVSPNGHPMIEVEASRYVKNVFNQPDTAYFVITTLHSLAFLFRILSAAITTKFPRHKLANDGTRFGAGQAVVTPNIIRAEIIAQYSALEFLGIVENMGAFKEALVVERDAINPNRVNVLFPPDLINQLRIFAVLAQFRLQFPTDLAA